MREMSTCRVEHSSRTAKAPATPAAWPIAIQVAITRALAIASWVADLHTKPLSPATKDQFFLAMKQKINLFISLKGLLIQIRTMRSTISPLKKILSDQTLHPIEYKALLLRDILLELFRNTC